MAGVSKVESVTDVKCSSHKFYEMMKYKLHHLPTIYPEGYTDAKILEGDGESEGSLRQWKYIIPGTTEEMFVKCRTIKQDDKNMITDLFVEEGSIHDHHKHFLFSVKVSPKADGGSSVKLTMEYEKHNDEMPDPHIHFELFKGMCEKVDAHVTLNENVNAPVVHSG